MSIFKLFLERHKSSNLNLVIGLINNYNSPNHICSKIKIKIRCNSLSSQPLPSTTEAQLPHKFQLLTSSNLLALQLSHKPTEIQTKTSITTWQKMCKLHLETLQWFSLNKLLGV